MDTLDAGLAGLPNRWWGMVMEEVPSSACACAGDVASLPSVALLSLFTAPVEELLLLSEALPGAVLLLLLLSEALPAAVVLLLSWLLLLLLLLLLLSLPLAAPVAELLLLLPVAASCVEVLPWVALLLLPTVGELLLLLLLVV